MTRSLVWRLILIALLAVGLRLAYQAGMESFGGSFNNGSDSNKYLNVAKTIVATGKFGNTTDDGRVVPATNRLPVYPYFLGAIFKLSHSESLRMVVTIQACLDFVTIIAIGLAAMAISVRIVLPAAVMAALIPNFIVQTSYILQENLFLVFFASALCALLWAVRVERPFWLLAASGLLLGLAQITRLALAYYGFFLVPALFYALAYRGKHSWGRSAALTAIPIVGILIVAAPLMTMNYINYGYAALSSQTGSHVLNWFYACLATPQPCAGRKQLLVQLNQIQDAEVERLGGEKANPFAVSEFQTRLAIERTSQLPVTQIATAMTIGIVKTLLQTGFYQVLGQFNQPETFFSTAKGTNLPARVLNFMTVNRSNYLMMMWLMAEICLVISRVFQVYGLLLGLRTPQTRPFLAIVFATTTYFLLIVGPVSSPRYRIPAEPPLILLFAVGVVFAKDRYWGPKPGAATNTAEGGAPA